MTERPSDVSSTAPTPPLQELPLIRPRRPPPPPLAAATIDAALSNPIRAVDVVLASPERVSQNL
ncbi:MAG: hypothetical protein SGI72_05470 [Planctomycetota bacterium]|nr:hypothetical protein [Planctomycetota bacterium]